MSDLTEAVAGPLWFLSLVAISHYVSLEAGLSVFVLSTIALCAWVIPDHMVRV